MIVSLNYADDRYKKHQKINTKTAYLFGKVNKVYSFSPEDIDNEFYEKNKNILSQEHRAGLWLWKPYFIDKVMNELKDGDVVCLRYVQSTLPRYLKSDMISSFNANIYSFCTEYTINIGLLERITLFQCICKIKFKFYFKTIIHKY